MNNLSHIVTSTVNVQASQAFEHLASPENLGRWALGCMDVNPTATVGVWVGTSIFDGTSAHVEIETNERSGIILFSVGSAERRAPWIMLRVMASDEAGLADGCCYVSLIAWRPGTMTDERWHRVCVAHEAEIYLIKDQCETATHVDPSEV